MPIEPVLEFFSTASPIGIIGLLVVTGAVIAYFVFKYLSAHEKTVQDQLKSADEQVDAAQETTRQLLVVYGELLVTLKQTASAMQNVAAVLSVVHTNQEDFYSRTDAINKEQLALLGTIQDGVKELPEKVESRVAPIVHTINTEIKTVLTAFNAQIEHLFKETTDKISLLLDVIETCKKELLPVKSEEPVSHE